jgi:hypothetical protein
MLPAQGQRGPTAHVPSEAYYGTVGAAPRVPSACSTRRINLGGRAGPLGRRSSRGRRAAMATKGTGSGWPYHDDLIRSCCRSLKLPKWTESRCQ